MTDWRLQRMSEPIHHLNCGQMRPPAQLIANGKGSLFRRGEAVCHCLLIETPGEGLILVDAGLGVADLQNPRKQLGLDVKLFLNPVPDFSFTAPAQIKSLGYDLNDVRRILVTHFDVDHRGALPDFPRATIHTSAIELDSLLNPRTRKDVKRYKGDWSRSLSFDGHDSTGDQWYGFPVVYETESSAGRVVLIHLPGHTSGHCGIAVETGGASPRWVLHAGDAIQHHNELYPGEPVPLGIGLFNAVLEADHSSRHRTRAHLRELAQEPDVEIICAHDPSLLPQGSRGVSGK